MSTNPTPTQRIALSALLPDEAGLLLRDGAPFSGLAYRVGAEGIVEGIEKVEGGRVVGASSDWLDLGAGHRLDRAHLELGDAYGPLLWRGAPVDGIVYVFDRQGVLLLEEAYDAGEPADTARREWYPSGAPKALLQGKDGSAWFEDGRLRSRRIDGTTTFNLVVREDGRLAGMTIDDRSLLDIASLEAMPLSDEVMLVGGAIDAALLQALVDGTKLASVPRLRFIQTALAADAVDVLASLPWPRELWLAKNASFGVPEAEALRARRPDFVVHDEAAP